MSLPLFLPTFAFYVTVLPLYRVLMVWVYDRTESLLVVVLMHASYIASTLFILQTQTTGASFLLFTWVFACALCALAAAVVLADRRHLARRERIDSIPGTRAVPSRSFP